MKKLRVCASCGTYSISASCASCGAQTRTAHPPKYTVEDKWAAYRRKIKYSPA